MMRVLGFVFVGVMFACCGPVEVETVVIRVLVIDELGRPVTGASVLLDSNAIGATGTAGEIRFEARENDREKLMVEIECPAGTNHVGSIQRSITPRRLSIVHPRSGLALPLECKFVCTSDVKSHVLVVRTDGRDALPLIIPGRELIYTDADGVAQIMLHGRPGEEVKVMIDTSGHPDLRPANPSRRISLPSVGRILVFDQDFVEKAPRAKKRRRDKKRAGPRRI